LNWIVLFDEIENAHADVFNTLADPRRRPAHRRSGCTVNFRNTVIIMTSNIGSVCLLDGVDAKARSPSRPAVRVRRRP
jgi:ATP-dependent Clp protease ATP-binding subunit ClpB